VVGSTANKLGSSLSRLRFENPDVSDHEGVAADRVDAGQGEACRFKERSPLPFAAFFAAGDGEHVEIAHQLAFQLWIRVRDERRKDEFDDQQTAVLRNAGAAVFEDGDCVRILTAVQDMFDHVDVGACGD